MAGAPFPVPAKQCALFHDGAISEQFDAILFSDPTMPSSGKWHSIGRPIPTYPLGHHNSATVTIGVHGFLGAQAHHVVAAAIREFSYATVRLSLPYSTFCDPSGHAARSYAQACRNMASNTGITIEVTHDFMPPDLLVWWLSENTVNCYFRDLAPWRGISSAPDSALAARRPLAVNKCSAFRHLHNCTPSICVEDSSLKDIIANGLKPLEPLYEQWSAENVRRQVEDVLLNL